MRAGIAAHDIYKQSDGMDCAVIYVHSYEPQL